MAMAWSYCSGGGNSIGTVYVKTGITVYAVLVYDWGTKDHCFMPVCFALSCLVHILPLSFTPNTTTIQIRRWVDTTSGDFFTLSERDRKTLTSAGIAAKEEIVLPSTKTPVEYWKEEIEGK